ncbi:MAG TPA: 2-hydroxychromene-2-carboxylate isomerase [Pseudomonadales bacterium]|nr:2-hydroxychromene-2-carboxylate isomerase [Pseudomonadales bacterium]
MTTPLSIDVFWSFRSPWSYLATPRLLDWSRRYDLDVVFRPVYPLAIRTPEFFDRQNPLWFSYFMTDVHRVAQFLDLPFKWPNPDPVVQEFRDGRRTTGAVQPYIYRLTRLGIVAAELGRGMEFADSVSRLIWGGTEHWYDGDHLAQATARAGLDLAAMDKTAVADVDRIEAAIARNQADHEAAGHWGVPTVAFRGEPFFGQDRLDVLLWRLRQNGLREVERGTR